MSSQKEKSFNEQGYLIWDHFIRNRPQFRNEGSKFSEGSTNMYGTTFHKIIGNYDPADFVSKTLNKKNKLDLYKKMLDMETPKLSSLTPEVKLFKIKDNKYTPFYFPTAVEETSMTSLLSPGASLGGVGIKNFDMKFEGTDFFTRDKSIVCGLSIYVDSMENIFREPPIGYAPLAELFTISRKRRVPLREGFSKEVSSEQINKASSHEIGATVGYSTMTSSGMFTSMEKRAIENTSFTLRLTYTGHTISVSNDGSATIDIKFIGRLSGVLSDPVYNVLSSASELMVLAKIQKEEESEFYTKRPDAASKKEKLESLNAKVRESVRQRYGRFLNVLHNDKKVNQLRVKSSDFNEYAAYVEKHAPKQSAESKESPPEDVPSDNKGKPETKTSTKTKDQKPTNNSLSLDYVYMGDFIQAVLHSVGLEIEKSIVELERESENTSLKKKQNIPAIKKLEQSLNELKSFKILFGKVVIVVDKDNYETTNLADIPVSTKLLSQYWFDNVEQRHVGRLSLNSFLEDMVSKVFPDAMNKHLYRDASKLPSQVSVKSLNITGESTRVLDKSGDAVDISQLPDFLKKTNSNRKKDDDVDYMVIYTDISSEAGLGRSGDEKLDTQNGVYHFNLSKDRGMIKSISFSQNTQQYRAEALMMESVSLYDELKMPYNANITMFGNGLFLPGSLIYINPSSIGFGDPRNKRSAAARLGLGGYYVVITVNTTYAEGQLITTITTQHQDWASEGGSVSTAESLQQTGIFDKAKRIMERNGGTSPVQRLF